MNTKTEPRPYIVPIDDEHQKMMDYARSLEGRAAIARAQGEIDDGRGILADDAYFEKLKERRAQMRSIK
jgi:hypothetical protein